MFKQCVLLTAFIVVISACRKSSSIPTKPAGQPIVFNNVLIIGNSITYTPANPAVGWPGSWGMAATTADSDYVHLLTAKFQKINPNCKVTIAESIPFESDWADYNLNENLGSYRALNPDLVILRFGEDVVQTPLDTASFGTAYRALVKYFSNNAIVLGVGSVWPRPITDAVMAKCQPFFTLGTLGTDLSIYSYGAWANPGIQQHPNDKGMRLIADSIWAHVNSLKRN
jgi:hypothetical protein